MTVYTQLITFTTAPVAISITDGNGRAITRATRIYAEPASGSHVMFVEQIGVATGANGGTAGVIRQLNPFSSTPLDSWEVASQKPSNIISLNQYQFDGTSGESIRVTIHVG
jgi:hypothetical protein